MGKLRLKDKNLIPDKEYIKTKLELCRTIHPNRCWSFGNCSLHLHVRTKIGKLICGVHVLSCYIYLGHDLNDPKMTLHKCGNGGCWNPEHLYKGDHKQNMKDCIEHGKFPASNKTHCKNGHEYKLGSFRMRRGWRECYLCIKIHTQNRRNK